MTKREVAQVGALLLIPLTSFLVVTGLAKDSYLSVSVSYMALLVVARFVDLDTFVLLPTMKSLRKVHNETRRTILLPATDISATPPAVETTPETLLRDKYVANAARLDYLVQETSRAVNNAREEMIKILFINIFLLVFLIILSSAQAPAVAPGAKMAPTTTSPLTPQVKLLSSYVAVAFQLLWIGQLLFHYRQRNVEAYAQNELGSSSSVQSVTPQAATSSSAA